MILKHLIILKYLDNMPLIKNVGWANVLFCPRVTIPRVQRVAHPTIP
jgi:hypothetical protein